MNRRSFLSSLSAFAATAALDPERLLWVKSKTIFIPPAPQLVSDKLFGVDFEYTDAELAMTIDDFRSRYIYPALEAIQREALAEMRFYYGSAWSSETISKAEFRRRYPDPKLSV